MAQLAELAAPEVRATTGLHRHHTGPQMGEEGQYPVPPQFLAQHRLSCDATGLSDPSDTGDRTAGDTLVMKGPMAARA